MTRAINRIAINIKFFLKKMCVPNVVDYFLVLLCLLCSGYAIFTTSNTTPRTIMAVVTCLLILARYVLSIKVNSFKRIKNNKKLLIPLPTIICFFVIGISAVITLFVNKESSYFISYVYYGVLVISACFLCRAISLKRFINIFCNILFVFSVTALILFGIQQIIRIPLGISFFELNNSICSNFFFIFFQNIYLNRLQSIFWEPGVYASFLIIALSFELLFKKNNNWFHIIVFLLSLIFTFSTAGYLLLILVFVPFLTRKTKNDTIQSIIKFSFFPLLILLVVLIISFSNQLATLFPTIFEKIANQNSSFSTRLLSPQIDFKIFMEKPFAGWGIHGANERYLDIITSDYSLSVDSQTSTTAGLLAKFGFLGIVFTAMPIVGIIGNKNLKLPLFDLICFALVFLLITNKEPHSNMLISWAIPFYFVYETFDKPIIQRREINQESETHSLLVVLKGKNDEGVVARNTVMSFGLKGVALLIGLFTIPVYSSYFSNDSTYGIWLTFLSIITWVMTFDLGFGNGMKNKLIDCLSKNDYERGKRIVSSTYVSSMIIGSIILSIGLLVINSLNLIKVFNFDTSTISPFFVRISFCITFSTIALEFILKNICHVFQAHQKHFLSNLLPLIANVSLLLFALFAKFNTPSEKILALSIAYCVITILPYLLSSVIAFAGPLKRISPSFKYASFATSKSVISLGLLFFLVQIALLFLNSIDQILISSLFSSESVVFYTKYSKFFTVIVSVSNIFNGIIWTSLCKSVADKNYRQLINRVRTLLLFDVAVSFLCVIIAIFMQPLLDVWLGASNTINANTFIVIIILLFTIENIFLSSTGSLLNGFQCLIPQAISIGCAATLKIPAILLIKHFIPSLSWEVIYIIDCFLWIPMLIVNIAFLIKNIRKAKIEVQECQKSQIE